jgi:hypothetical protein
MTSHSLQGSRRGDTVHKSRCGKLPAIVLRNAEGSRDPRGPRCGNGTPRANDARLGDQPTRAWTSLAREYLLRSSVPETQAPDRCPLPGAIAAIDSPPPRGPRGPGTKPQLPCSQVSHCSGTPRPSSPFYRPAGLCCFLSFPDCPLHWAAVNINHPKSGIEKEADRL